MNQRIPIMYDRPLRPEWIDFALEQYLKAEHEVTLRRALIEYLRPQICGAETLEKTARQLQRTVGFKSPIPKDRLADIHAQMSALSPDQRKALRVQLLCEATPFVEDCLEAMKRLAVLGVKGVEIKHIYERIASKYGDRSMVYRGVRYVLQTLTILGVVEHHNNKWCLAINSQIR